MTRRHLGLQLALVLASVAPLTAVADDWLIAREAGAWALVEKGAAGRVAKTAPNQEVLRLGENGVVWVMTLPAGDSEGRIFCTEQERADHREACSSAFLDCKSEDGGLGRVLLGAVIGGSDGAKAQRNRYLCRVDENAILQAALAVGMIGRILPQSTP